MQPMTWSTLIFKTVQKIKMNEFFNLTIKSHIMILLYDLNVTFIITKILNNIFLKENNEF